MFLPELLLIEEASSSILDVPCFPHVSLLLRSVCSPKISERESEVPLATPIFCFLSIISIYLSRFMSSFIS